jgi:YNFM family putative membrane transporter
MHWSHGRIPGTVGRVTTTIRAVAAPDLRHRPGSAGFRRLNLAMCLVGLAGFGLLYATQPVLPELSAEFGVPAATASLSVSATTGALALLVVPATLLGLRVGRVRLVLGGLLAAVLLTLLAAVAPTFPLLVVLRGLGGAALACAVAVAMGHVAAEVHPRGLAAAMGLYVAGNSLGGVGGRLVTAGLTDLVSWRWAVGGLAVVALLAALAAWWLLPDPVQAAPERARGERGFGALLCDPAVVAVLVVPFVLMGGFVATFNYLAYRLVAPPFALPPSVVGLVFLSYLCGTASSAAAGSLAGRVGRGPVLLGALGVMTAGLALTVPDMVPTLVVGLVLLTAGFFAAHAVASGWAPVVGSASPSRASGLYVTSYYAGSSVLGALAGLAWDAAGWPAVAATVGGLVAVAALATAYLWRISARACSAARP